MASIVAGLPVRLLWPCHSWLVVPASAFMPWVRWPLRHHRRTASPRVRRVRARVTRHCWAMRPRLQEVPKQAWLGCKVGGQR